MTSCITARPYDCEPQQSKSHAITVLQKQAGTCLPAFPAPAAETVSASSEDTVRPGKTQACVDNARLESVARFGKGGAAGGGGLR